MHVRSLSRADILLANSSFTGREAQQLAPGKLVKVVHHDCDPEYKSPVIHEHPYIESLEEHDFVLYSGRVAPRYKNIRTLLRAFSLYSKTYTHSKLVLVYSDHFRITDRLTLLRNRHNVDLLRQVPRKFLIQLYRNAKMFIYPSSYEGFGSPVLEAQNSRCPLIANRVPPLPEVAGDGALYYDGSPKGLATKMLQLAKDDILRDNLVQRGVANAQRFDWRITAEETLKCLNSLA